MKPKTLRIAACAAAAPLMLAACGGGGSSPSLTDNAIDRSDPRVIRLGGILERSDTLLISSIHTDVTLAFQGFPVGEERSVENMSCAGARCVGEHGDVTTVQDLFDPSADIDPSAGIEVIGADIGSRGGFDTITATGGLKESNSFPDGMITAAPTVNVYGLWGEYGFAAVQIVDGSLSGEDQGVSFAGDFSDAMAYAVGDAAGTNPAGLGAATWTGIAEAASTDTFQWRSGTATITIADLSDPRVSVGIDVPWICDRCACMGRHSACRRPLRCRNRRQRLPGRELPWPGPRRNLRCLRYRGLHRRVRSDTGPIERGSFSRTALACPGARHRGHIRGLR